VPFLRSSEEAENDEAALRNDADDVSMNLSKNGKLGAIAVVVVALAAGGAAFAATKIHTSSHTTGSFGGPMRSGGFGAGGGGYFPGAGSGTAPRGGGFGGRGGSFGRGGGLEAAATYLGISTTDLFTDIRSGKSLADIANATSGKSASGLIDAMVAAQEQQIEAAVKSGRLTQAQAAQLTANLKTRVTAMVNGSGFGGPPGGGTGFGFGRGGGGGGQAPSQGSSSSQPGHI
jgi:hypothetical protein